MLEDSVVKADRLSQSSLPESSSSSESGRNTDRRRSSGCSVFGTEGFEDFLVFTAVDESLRRLRHAAIGRQRDRPLQSWAWRFSLNSTDETVKGVFVIQSGEFDPASLGEKGGNLVGLLESGEKDGDYRVIRFAGSPIERGQHLLTMPGTEALGADEDDAGSAVPQSVLQLYLPESARNEVPLVEERVDLGFEELVGELLHRRLVGAAVAEEDVVDG